MQRNLLLTIMQFEILPLIEKQSNKLKPLKFNLIEKLENFMALNKKSACVSRFLL